MVQHPLERFLTILKSFLKGHPLTDASLSTYFNSTVRAAEIAEMLRAPSATSKNQVQCPALISKDSDTLMPHAHLDCRIHGLEGTLLSTLQRDFLKSSSHFSNVTL